ncbi:MAG: 5-deoxy-glucuronate isomerase [Nonlabens sp.]|jgi:5-deoxy-glucuronate isomerase
MINHHIEPYDNKNKPIVDVDNTSVPLVYFNHVKLNKGESHSYQLENHESVMSVVQGTIDVIVDSEAFNTVGKRKSLWKGKPEGVYAGKGAEVKFKAVSENGAEIYVAGGKIENKYPAFYVNQDEVTKVQYGSDDTKTHRKIFHVLGQNAEGRAGRLLVSELFTVGAGGWSGFPPHKHDEDRHPIETRFEEVYQFRFNPPHGFGAQFMYPEDDSYGPVYHVKDQSNIMIDRGYHPSVAAPGYEMYYFTIIVGETHRSLIQYFHPDHAYQLETIPGIKDMISHFK